MEYLAKSKPKETVEEHTKNLLLELERLKSCYPNVNFIDWEMLEIVCLYHDFGKINSKFQQKIQNNINGIKISMIDNEIPHGYLSPAFLPINELEEMYSRDEIKIIMQSIYYHHKRPSKDFSQVKEEIEIDLLGKINKLNICGIKCSSLNTKYNKYIKRRIEEDEDYDNTEIRKRYVITKGLLNKIDYAASSGVEVERKNQGLLEKTLSFIDRNNFQINNLQNFMIENTENNVVAIASTGIGKTEGALFWIGNGKGFFTLPLRVSINAIYDRIINCKKINFPKEYTGLLHSNTPSEYIKRDDNNELDKNYLDTTRQLSMPLTVCTLDQIIDFIFKYEGYELKLATLSYSKLVIDEVQMYSADMLAYLIVAIKSIVEFGGKFAILTATLPPIVEELIAYPLLENGKRISYIKPKKAFIKLNSCGKSVIRHSVQVKEGRIQVEDILSKYKDNKLLIIVNTVKEAQRIYSELNERFPGEVNIFHSLYISKDKKKIEEKILNMGSTSSKESGIWVTTQVVEASLDIDFDILYTELSELSGLFQRMGRVYRNRELKNNVTNVYVYIGNDKEYPTGISINDKSIVDIDIFNLSKKVIKEVKNGIITEEEKMNMIENTYTLENLRNSTYYKKVKDKINEMLKITPYTYNKSDVDLRRIDSVTIIPKIIYDEIFYKIEEIREKISTANSLSERISLKDQIMENTLAIPSFRYKNAEKKGEVIGKIEVDKFTYIPIVNFEYDEMGLKFLYSENPEDRYI